MKTKQVPKTVYTTVYVTDDGREFSNERDARDHESRSNGTRKTCTSCGGKGQTNIREETSYHPGYEPSTYTTGDRCRACNGKGYLEKVTEWK
jgi:DnaJ-class molecular chaperone